MEYVDRDTYQDRLANFKTDNNIMFSINIYLINKIKVTSFYNMIKRATNALCKDRCTIDFTNINKYTKGFSNKITYKFTRWDFSTTINIFTHIFRR